MSAEQEVDDSFIFIRLRNVEDKLNVCLISCERDGMSRESNLGTSMLPCLLYAHNDLLWIACF